MKSLYKYILLLWVVGLNITAFSNSRMVNDSVHVEVLLGADMLKEIKLDIGFVSSFAVTKNDHILLSSSKQFYLLGWGGIVPVGKETAEPISSFAYALNDYLMVVRNSELCYIDTAGSVSRLYELPNADMGITGDKNEIYLFDKKIQNNRSVIYGLSNTKHYYELISLANPVNAMVKTKGGIVFATQNKLLAIDINKKEVKALAELPDIKSKIISIAHDSINKVIFFSSENAIYAMNDSDIVCITDKFSGILNYHKKGLLVFNPDKQFLIRLPFYSGYVAAAVAETLTNESIIEMVNAKLSEQEIIETINKSEVDFKVDVDAMIYLSSRQVSSAIIMAMKNAMKKKNANTIK